MENQLQLAEQQSTDLSFGNSQQFEHAQRVAKMLITASLIPDHFKNNMANVMIALEMANRINVNPMMVMQNLYVVHGKPSWSSQFIISVINSCGRFTPLRFDQSGEGESLSCTAWATDKKTGDKLTGVTVTMQMANAEGWVNKSGSKWKTMPQLMIRYRAATFFGRLYASDILMGMHTEDEVEDFTVMASEGQESYINSLLATSTYDEQQRRAIEWKVNSGMSTGEAMEIIANLKLNQLDPVTQGSNYSQTEIKEKINGMTK